MDFFLFSPFSFIFVDSHNHSSFVAHSFGGNNDDDDDDDADDDEDDDGDKDGDDQNCLKNAKIGLGLLLV